jgi:gas vesicle protein
MGQQNNENNFKSLDLESLNTEYKNLLTEYKLAVSNYIDYLKKEFDKPCKDFTPTSKNIDQKCYQEMASIKGAAYWGTSELSQNNSSILKECKATCANTKGCSGATFNSDKQQCWLRSGDGQIVGGLPNDYAIVTKGEQLLKIIKNINEKLTQVNKKFQEITNIVGKKFNTQSGQLSSNNTDLIKQYSDLIKERTKIKRMLEEYQTLDEKQIEGSKHISQNYYFFILLILFVLLFVYILYNLSSHMTTSSNSIIQTGGELSNNTYYIIFGIGFIILLTNLFNKYKLL